MVSAKKSVLDSGQQADVLIRDIKKIGGTALMQPSTLAEIANNQRSRLNVHGFDTV
jgi:hypothetical protein